MVEKSTGRKEEVVTREYTINLHKRLHGWYASASKVLYLHCKLLFITCFVYHLSHFATPSLMLHLSLHTNHFMGSVLKNNFTFTSTSILDLSYTIDLCMLFICFDSDE